MPCGGGATHAAYQPFRAFNMAAKATGVGVDISTGGGSYGNPPLPSSYPNVGLNPYGPQFPPPAGAYGEGPINAPPRRVQFAPGPYGELPPMESAAAAAAAAYAAGSSDKSDKSDKSNTTCKKGSNAYKCWPTAAKATLWTAVSIVAFAALLLTTIAVLRRTRRF
jgi:hypothetical protein